MSHNTSLFSSSKTEIIEIHAFFVHWFTEDQARPQEFERFETALDANFTMGTPDGLVHDRAEVLWRLRRAKAATKKKFAIEIEEITEIWASDNAVLVGYVEAQSIDERHTRRRSTALFVRNDATPHGVAWRHLHETWIERLEGAKEAIAKALS